MIPLGLVIGKRISTLGRASRRGSLTFKKETLARWTSFRFWKLLGLDGKPGITVPIVLPVHDEAKIQKRAKRRGS